MRVFTQEPKPDGAVEQGLDDEERWLVEQAKQDPEAFGQLYQRYVKRIYGYHYQFTRNREEAEDLTSRTFFQALRGIGTYAERGLRFQAWLYRIAHNLMANWCRDQSRHPVTDLESVELVLAAEEGNPQADLAGAEERERMRLAVEALPEDRKTLLILKFVEKMPNSEIARVLGRSEGAVKVLYHRTLSSLREQAKGVPRGGADVSMD